MRRFAALFCALFLLLGGCEEESAPSPSVSPSPLPVVSLPAVPSPTPVPEAAEFALPCDPAGSFHPITGTQALNLLLAPLMYEGLYELDETFSPQALLCEASQVSEDGLTWTFTLKSGVTFSDGSPLTAADAASSLRLACTAESLYHTRLAGISSIRAEGERTLLVTLFSPNGNLPALLDIPICKGSGEIPLGTGPYVLTGEEGDRSLVFRRDWWRHKKAPAQTIPLRPVSGTDGLISAFDTQEISLVSQDVTSPNAPYYSSSYESRDYPTSVMLYVGYNTGKDRLCQEAEVRQALSRCFDRDELCSGVLLGHAQAAALPMSPLCSIYSRSIDSSLSYDPAEAAALLEGAGWVQGEEGWTKGRDTLSPVLIVNSDNLFKTAAAQALAEDLTQAGIAVELRTLSWEEYLAALENGEFDLYLGEVKLTADFDLTPLLSPEGSLNYGKFENETLSLYFYDLLAARSGGRTAAARQFFREFGRQAPFTPLCFKTHSLLTHDSAVWEPAPTQQNLFYGFFAAHTTGSGE